MMRAFLAVFVVAALGSCGKTNLSDKKACDGSATVNQICGWNNVTQEYDRACVYFCSDLTCPAGSSVQAQCAWNAETQAYDRDCHAVCAGDGGVTQTRL